MFPGPAGKVFPFKGIICIADFAAFYPDRPAELLVKELALNGCHVHEGIEIMLVISKHESSPGPPPYLVNLFKLIIKGLFIYKFTQGPFHILEIRIEINVKLKLVIAVSHSIDKKPI